MSTPIYKSELANKVGMSLKADIQKRMDKKDEMTTINDLFYQPAS